MCCSFCSGKAVFDQQEVAAGGDSHPIGTSFPHDLDSSRLGMQMEEQEVHTHAHLDQPIHTGTPPWNRTLNRVLKYVLNGSDHINVALPGHARFSCGSLCYFPETLCALNVFLSKL